MEEETDKPKSIIEEVEEVILDELESNKKVLVGVLLLKQEKERNNQSS